MKKKVMLIVAMLSVGATTLVGCGNSTKSEPKQETKKESKQSVDKDVPGAQENIKGKVIEKKIVGGDN